MCNPSLSVFKFNYHTTFVQSFSFSPLLHFLESVTTTIPTVVAAAAVALEENEKLEVINTIVIKLNGAKQFLA